MDTVVEYIAADSQASAVGFTEAVRSAFQRLAEMPGVGSLQEFHSPRLSGIRMWPVPRFRNFLIFYRVENEVVLIIRILHGARDIPVLLEGEDIEH